jgi:hypothetical protein
MGVNLVFVTANVVAASLFAAVLVVGLRRHHVGIRLAAQLHDQGVADQMPPVSVAASAHPAHLLRRVGRGSHVDPGVDGHGPQ